MKRWLARLGVALGFAAACVAALEALLRVAAPVPLNSPRFRTSERYCTELIAGSDGVITTADFRDAFHVDERGRRVGGSPHAAGARTVAVVGDSMVFGEGVADGETFVARLPEALAALGAGEWDAWNLGIGGQGTGQHVARLEDLVASGAKPNVALVTFFANDPRDDRECRPFHFADDHVTLERAVPADMAHPPPKRLPWLVEQPIYRWITSHSQIVGRLRLRAARNPEKRAAPAGANALDEPMTPEELRLTNALYQRLAADSRSWGVPIGIVLVPNKGCFAGDAMRACAEKLDTVARIAAESGLPLLDLRGSFGAERIDSDYYPHDLHWTAAGHARAAPPIAAFVARLAAAPREAERPLL